ncbi:MAG: hypothetical protein ACHQ1H_05700 [Nitrososphaerales archaeon]
MSGNIAINGNAPAQQQDAGWFGWVALMPSREELMNANCSSLLERVIHGWQVALIMGAAVASIVQAVAAIFAGMIGHALLSTGVACVLLFAAGYVMQHHLIAETRRQLGEAREHVQALNHSLGRAEQVLGLANNVADRLEPGAVRIENAADRMEPLADNLGNLIPRVQALFQLLDEPQMRAQIAELEQAARNADLNRERFEKSAADAQTKYNTVVAQLEETTRALNQTRHHLDTSVAQAGKKFNEAADGAKVMVAQLGQAMGSPDPVHPARRLIAAS